MVKLLKVKVFKFTIDKTLYYGEWLEPTFDTLDEAQGYLFDCYEIIEPEDYGIEGICDDWYTLPLDYTRFFGAIDTFSNERDFIFAINEISNPFIGLTDSVKNIKLIME